MARKPKMTDDDVRLRAEGVVKQKGYPWSETEFNCHLVETRRNLKRGGATKEQMEEFDRLVREAPIRRGHFNRYSGD